MARRHILGLDLEQDSEVNPTDKAAPAPDSEHSTLGATEKSHRDVSTNPLLRGEVLITIFDTAMVELDDEKAAQLFFRLLNEFPSLPCTKSIAAYIVDYMQRNAPEASSTVICSIQLPVLGMRANSAEFPQAFSKCLDEMSQKNMMAKLDLDTLCQLLMWNASFLKIENVDSAIRDVLLSTLRQFSHLVIGLIQNGTSKAPENLSSIIEVLKQLDCGDDVRMLESVSSNNSTDGIRLQDLRGPNLLLESI